MEWTDLDRAYLDIFGEHPDVYYCGTPQVDDLLESLSVARPTVLFMPQPVVYEPAERPDVEVLWEGTWCPGEVRMVTWDDQGAEVHQVQYRRSGELSSHIDDFTADRMRPDSIDRSLGRG